MNNNYKILNDVLMNWNNESEDKSDNIISAKSIKSEVQPIPGLIKYDWLEWPVFKNSVYRMQYYRYNSFMTVKYYHSKIKSFINDFIETSKKLYDGNWLSHDGFMLSGEYEYFEKEIIKFFEYFTKIENNKYGNFNEYHNPKKILRLGKVFTKIFNKIIAEPGVSEILSKWTEDNSKITITKWYADPDPQGFAVILENNLNNSREELEIINGAVEKVADDLNLEFIDFTAGSTNKLGIRCAILMSEEYYDKETNS